MCYQLYHSAIEPFYILLRIKAPIGIEPMYSGSIDHPLYHSRIELKNVPPTGFEPVRSFATKGS